MRIRALLFAGLFVALSLVAAPANAANQISGEAQLIPSSAPLSRCPVESGYPDYSAIEMTGSLEGCWYTKILTPIPFETTPSGVYLESGEEKFVGNVQRSALDGSLFYANPQFLTDLDHTIASYSGKY